MMAKIIIKDMQDALMLLAYEMTFSEDTATDCMSIMNLSDDEDLFDIADYLNYLIKKEKDEGLV